MTRASRWRRGISGAVLVVLGSGIGTAWAAFSNTTSNGPNTFSVAAPDTTPPVIVRAVATKTSGATPGTIRQGGDYHVYAQVTDESPIASVTADTSSFDNGVTSAALSDAGGPWTIGGLSYNYRSAVLTADTPLITGSSYFYTVTAADDVGNTSSPASFSVTIETYVATVQGRTGLVGYWRLHDGAQSADEFTDTAGKDLGSHTGSLGETWTRFPNQALSAVITNENRLRKQTATGGSYHYSSVTPASANYVVEADVHVKSILAGDGAAVVGRIDLSNTNGIGTNYFARYDVAAGQWQLFKNVNNTATNLGGFAQTLNVGQTYRLSLMMNGTAISLLVDGVTSVGPVTDTAIAGAGRGGIRLGSGTSVAAVSDTAGLHVDNFRISSLTTTAADSKGTNHGTFTNGPLLNQPGALVGTTNRAVTFDGVNDFVSIPHSSSLTLGNSLTLEAWIRPSTLSGTRWIINKGTYYYLYIQNGQTIFGINTPTGGYLYVQSGAVTTNSWQHVVGTYDGSKLVLYRNGVNIAEATISGSVTANTSPVYLGAFDPTGSYFQGSMDEHAIYNVGLTPAQVMDNYHAGSGTG